jgi:hypothetical protein
MSRLVFDIETLGVPIESLDEERQEYLLHFAKNEEERQDAILKLSLYPLTAQVLAIGMYNPDTERGKVIYQSDSSPLQANDTTVKYVTGTEKEILQMFWDDITKYDQFVTFNGRGFDCPFLMLRSAVLNVKPSRNLMPYRYEYREHCDLLEQFTFYGVLRKFNLDFYCKSFGIESPKAQGITGHDMAKLVEAKRFDDIASYCYRDVLSTAKLFRLWENYLKV